MRTFKKTFSHLSPFLLIALMSFVITRGIFILSFPLFFDEAIYIRWAQYIIDDWFWKFISLTDGKQPFLIWLISVTNRIIPDAVIAGRIVSFFAGLGSMIGLYLLSKTLFSRKTALLSLFFYVLLPFYLMHDGLALMDGLLLTCSIFACYFTICLAKKPNPKHALLLGVSIGLGLLTKSSASFSLYLLPSGLLFLQNKKNLLRYAIFALSAAAIAYLIASILRLSAYYDFIAQKNSVFLYTFAEIQKQPFIALFSNAPQLLEWLITYLGLPLLLLAPLSIVFPHKRRVIFFLLYTLIPLLSLAVFGKQLYPRYALFMTFPLLILASYSITELLNRFPKKRFVIASVVFLLFLPQLVTSTKLLMNPQSAPLPIIDRWQFFEGEPSGIGMDQLVSYFQERQDKKLLIMTDKAIGILPDGIAIHFHRNKNVTVVGTDGITKKKAQAEYRKVFPEEMYIVQSWQGIPADISLQQVLEIKRPGERNYSWRVYRVDASSLR